MKIGAFAAAHSVSIDTVRHYIDLGLLLPEKQGGQYAFCERCGGDPEETTSPHAMGFTLAEIRTVFMFRRLGRLTAYKQDAAFHELFVNKFSKISGLLEELRQISRRLEDKIRELDAEKEKKLFKLGVHLKNLRLLQCASCQGELVLQQAQIINNQVMEGSLECKCGMQYVIDDGILMSGKMNIKDGSDNGSAVEVLNYDQVSDYIKNTDDAYLQNVYKSLEWAYRRMDFKELEGKILLEFGSGLGFFLRVCYDELPENAVYIAVDHDIRMQKYLKHMLEISGVGKNILFVCADFLQLPLIDKAADMVLDLSGTSNYSFNHEDFLLKTASGYFSDKACLLGGYILFRNFSADSRVVAANRKNFKYDNIKNEISALGFETISETVSEYLEKGGKYESYFIHGEKVNSFTIYAKRSGTHKV